MLHEYLCIYDNAWDWLPIPDAIMRVPTCKGRNTFTVSFPCNVSGCLTIKYIIWWLAGEQKGNMDPTLPLFHLQMNNYQGILGFQRNSVSPQHLVLSRQTYLLVWKIFCAFRLLPNSGCLCRLRKETTFVIWNYKNLEMAVQWFPRSELMP